MYSTFGMLPSKSLSQNTSDRVGPAWVTDPVGTGAQELLKKEMNSYAKEGELNLRGVNQFLPQKYTYMNII